MSRKTLSLIIILLILTVVLVIVAIGAKDGPVTSVNNETTKTTSTLKPTATITPGQTLLSMSPNPAHLSTIGSTSATTVAINIDTGTDNVTAVQLEIAYDPTQLLGMTIKPGDFFVDAMVLPVGGVNAKTGRITYAVTSGSIKANKNGKGIVAILSFYPTRNTTLSSTPITILDKSLVTAVGLGAQSVLKTSTGTTVMLSIPKPSATMSVTP